MPKFKLFLMELLDRVAFFMNFLCNLPLFGSNLSLDDSVNAKKQMSLFCIQLVGWRKREKKSFYGYGSVSSKQNEMDSLITQKFKPAEKIFKFGAIYLIFCSEKERKIVLKKINVVKSYISNEQ